MGGNLDSIVDVLSRILVFRVGQIRRLLLEAAECSLVNPADEVKCHEARRKRKSASLVLVPWANLEYHFGVSHVPD